MIDGWLTPEDVIELARLRTVGTVRVHQCRDEPQPVRGNGGRFTPAPQVSKAALAAINRMPRHATRRKEVLRHIALYGKATSSDIAGVFDIPETNAWAVLTRLVGDGLLKRAGQRRHFTYSLAVALQ